MGAPLARRIVAAALNFSRAPTEISRFVSWNDHAPILNGDRFGRIGEHPTLASGSARARQLDAGSGGLLKFGDELLIPVGAPVGHQVGGRWLLD